MRGLCSALVILSSVGCATEAGGEIEASFGGDKADGSSSRLKTVDRHRLDIDEPSDLTIVDGNLYVVSDRHSRIYEISRRGRTKNTRNIEGSDLEALSFDNEHNTFIVADESSGKIWRIDDDGSRKAPIELEDTQDGNSGIEGLAFDDDGHLFVAKEKNPARIYELDDNGDVLHDKKIEFADDLSALAWNPDDGHLYALSDEEHTLYKLDRDLDVDTAWKLPIEHPEGLAFDGDRIFIVSDSEERLYELERD
ncbi:MAG: SdiA-regulated domain-containing protein [Deltaproteobacteria bacterium]|nr:SdiA-regulated domain-containing protein [Deltaproteobacteria bacterium]